MPAEITLSTGTTCVDATRDSITLMNALNTVRNGSPMPGMSGAAVPPGWLEIATDAEPVYINPAHVVEIRDYVDMPEVEETSGRLG